MAIICNSTSVKTVKIGDTEIFEVREALTGKLVYNKMVADVTIDSTPTLYGEYIQTLTLTTSHQPEEVSWDVSVINGDTGDIVFNEKIDRSSFSVVLELPREVYGVGVVEYYIYITRIIRGSVASGEIRFDGISTDYEGFKRTTFYL